MANTSSTTILQTSEWAKRFCSNRPFAIGNFLEPAITNANTILQTILGAPFRWRWNRIVTGFVTVSGQQDYTLFNWAAQTNVKLKWMTVDSNGNCQTVSTAGPTGTTPPSWNTATAGTTADGSAVWTNLGPISTPVSQTYDFDWIETASLQAPNPGSGVLEWKQISTKIALELDSAQSRPAFVAAQGDDGQGNITFRLMPVPEQTYQVALTIQQKPPIIDSVNDTWAPIPDEYSRIYNWGYLALLFLFTDDPRFTTANQKFVTAMISANQGLTQTEMNIWLNNWQAITGQPVVNSMVQSQGQQARGV